MDNTRLFLLIGISFVSIMLWDAWQRDYAAPPPAPATQSTAPVGIPDAPPDTRQAPSASESPTAPQLIFEPADRAGDVVSVTSDVLELEINLTGGGITHARLVEYPIDVDKPEQHFALLDQTAERFFIHQGGMKGNFAAPDHRSEFSAAKSNYELGNAESLTVDLNWTSPEGLLIVKRYTVTRGSYLVGVEYRLRNNTNEPWQGRAYEQLQRAKPESKRSLVYTFTGAALSTPDKLYEKFDFDDLEDAPLKVDATESWVGILEHYFVTALLPPPQQTSHFYSLILDQTRYAVGFWSPSIRVEAGAVGTIASSIYIGPKLQEVLHDIAPGLDRTVDFGVLWFIAEPLFKVLQYIRDVTGNWGWSIIILTFLLKLAFYPLSAAGYRSMAKMRKVQPRMLALKERYGSDRARLNQGMMELYKEEKINPLGGCLPILVQIPVFISLYWVLLESVELRQAPFGLWLMDLSSKDPLYVLPLIMGVSMWIQQKLNPAPMDPVQQKVMQILPFAFTIFFMFFPSGLVLYWVVNNILSIAQQWHITRTIEKSGAAN